VQVVKLFATGILAEQSHLAKQEQVEYALPWEVRLDQL
jgi:hypothetical protein